MASVEESTSSGSSLSAAIFVIFHIFHKPGAAGESRLIAGAPGHSLLLYGSRALPETIPFSVKDLPHHKNDGSSSLSRVRRKSNIEDK